MAPTIGQQIERLRIKLAMSQTEFGKRFHMTAMSVSRWERNVNAPEAQDLLKLGLMAKQVGMDGWMFWNEAGLTRDHARTALARDKMKAAAAGQ